MALRGRRHPWRGPVNKRRAARAVLWGESARGERGAGSRGKGWEAGVHWFMIPVSSSTSWIRWPIQRITGTAIELPSAL